MDKIERLNRCVTRAIFAQEQNRDYKKARSLLLRVSRVEELLANEFPPDDVHGWMARRGAILSALKARSHPRALRLLVKYRNESISSDKKAELEQLFLSLF